MWRLLTRSGQHTLLKSQSRSEEGASVAIAVWHIGGNGCLCAYGRYLGASATPTHALAAKAKSARASRNGAKLPGLPP